MMKETDSGLTIDGIYLIIAFEIRAVIVYIFPDSGHLLGDMCRFLSRKLIQIWRQV